MVQLGKNIIKPDDVGRSRGVGGIGPTTKESKVSETTRRNEKDRPQ